MGDEYFLENGYCILKNVLDKQTLELLKTQMKLQEKITCIKSNTLPENFISNDKQCKNSFSIYGLLCFEALLKVLQPNIEEKTGVSLDPTYSYARIYYPGSILNKHKDRESCEYSATICISCDGEPWDIFFKAKSGEEKCITMNEGDLVIYKGMELEHWREQYKGNSQIQVFLHYVNKNGPHAHFKYDKRTFLGFAK
jgi:hypothetical protein